MLAIMGDCTKVGVHLSRRSGKACRAHRAGSSDRISYIMQTHLLDKAAKVITSPQVLVNVISRRVRQLMDGQRPLVEVQPRMGLADIALSEVIEGKITYEHTKGFIPEVIAPRIAKLGELTLKEQAA